MNKFSRKKLQIKTHDIMKIKKGGLASNDDCNCEMECWCESDCWNDGANMKMKNLFTFSTLKSTRSRLR